MGRVSGNSITSLDQDWGLDTNTNLPFSGEAVQNFIKSFLRTVTGAAWFDPTNYTMYFFANDEDRQAFISDHSLTNLVVFSCPMNFSSTMYRVDITNNTGATQINVATNAGTLPLSQSFIIQTKDISGQSWTDTQTAAYVTILIDRGLSGNYVAITDRILYASGATIALDVFNELAVGSNRVKFQYEAEDGTVTSSFVYSITLAEMYVELFNNTWYQPIVTNVSDSWYLGGFRIAGAGYKTLHISVYNQSGTKLIDDLTAAIGTTNAYISTPYYYRWEAGSHPILALSTGVYKARVYITTETMTSEFIEYNFMVIKASDVSSAQLVCVNDVADKIFNYSTSQICKYAVYNGLASTGNPTVTFSRMHGSAVVDTSTVSFSDIPVKVEQSLEYSAEWGVEGVDYFIGFAITLGSGSGEGVVPLDNSTVFPPTAGFDFYMNPSSRNNGESDSARRKVINEATGQALTANWDDVDCIDGVDGWTTDDNGRKCLRIAAGSNFTLPYTEFKFLDNDNISFEICYRIKNVSNYTEQAMTIAENRLSAGFKGIRIMPTNVTVHSANDTNASNDSKRGTNVCDEDVIHFMLVINPNFEGQNKLVKGFINGCKNFEFAYNASTDWPTNASLMIGCAHSDIEVYFIRRYATALGDPMVQANYINSLTSVSERTDVNAKFASVLEAGGANIDFEAVKNHNYNYFVVHMADDGGVPSAANGWQKDTKKFSSLEMHFGEHPEWDFKIEDVETMGQGTTSMNYYRWNIRWRIDKSNDDKKVPVSYVTQRRKSGQSYQYDWSTPALSKTVRFDGTTHPAVMRITAKINQASSMQSHKMGATRAYTELHDAVGLRNEAQTAADQAGTPRPTVAVYEYPSFGFEYNSMYNTYTFIGLFTIGPDKGDKPTFGYDTVKSTLISMEGTDHNQPLAKFAYPWNNDVNFFYNKEGIAIDKGEGVFETGLEVGNCHGADTDKASGQDTVRQILAAQFKDAYDLVWHNSTLIFYVNPSTYGQSNVSATLSYINSHLTAFRDTMYNDRLSYADMQFWIVGDATYQLYYYDIVQGAYVAGDNLSSMHGTPSGSTNEAKNDWFKAARRTRFMAGAENYFDIQDALFHFVFCVIFGATDNFAKNSYPYKMALLSSGGRWKWRQDDLDTIFDIDNLGGDTKPYQIEFLDAVGNSPYFAGSNSVFWNLIYECYWNDYNNNPGLRTMGGNVITQMRQLAGASNTYQGFIDYIKRCFWDRAQSYFPQSAYNVDANFKYEQAWLANGQAADPLAQSLGNHLSGEKLWVQRRAVYMMSLFKAGPFGDYSDGNLGTIACRPMGFTFNLKPNMWLYPAIAPGQSTPTSAGRTQPGQTATMEFSGADGNTEYRIQATNYLMELGNFKNLILGSGYISTLAINGKKLTKFVIGDATAGNVTTNVPGLTFTGTACMEEIDARNASSISGALNLSDCTRLRKLYLTGTSLTSVNIPLGSKVGEVSLPATVNGIELRQLGHLSIENFSVAGYSHVTSVLVDKCTDLDAYTILEDAYNGSSVLQYVRAVWSGIVTDADNSSVTVLPALANGNYQGLDYEGNPIDAPYVEGTIRLDGVLYTAGLDAIDIVSETSYGQTMKKALSGLFNTNLYFIYNPGAVYISFADPDVESICVTNWGDENGLLISQAEAVTSIGTLFRANTDIDSFDELKYFTGITQIPGSSNSNGAFQGCSNLTSVTLPTSVKTIGAYAFFNCQSLESINLENVTSIGQNGFSNDIMITEINAPSLTSLGVTSFYKCLSLERIISLGSITNIPGSSGYGTFEGCTSLVSVALPSTMTRIGTRAFWGCTALTTVTGTSNLTRIDDNAFYNCPSLTNIAIPPSVTFIGGRAFYNCRLTGDLYLPNLTSNVSASAFAACQFERILSLGSTTQIENRQTGNLGTFQNNTQLKSVVLPETLKIIGMQAFQGCTALETINLPQAITAVRGNAFLDCVNMAIEVNLPNLTTLEVSSFRHCGITAIRNLGSITQLDAGIESNTYFRNCPNLTYACLPSTLTLVHFETFWYSPIDTFVFLATTPPTCKGVNRLRSTAKVYVPYSADHSILDAYKTASNWSSVASQLYELDEDGNIPT